jgi:hypothetical protein
MSRLHIGRPDVAMLTLLFLTLALTARLGIGVITDAGDQVDARHYVAAGMTLAREGVFGYGSEPNMYREPLTSWTIAAQAILDPRLRGLGFEDVDGDGPGARAVKQQNLVWAALTLFGVGQLALMMLGGRGRRETLIAILAVIATHVVFLEWADVTDRSLSELPAAAILVWATVLALRAVDRPRPRSWFGLGVLLGLLALTKASFLYVALVFVPLLMIARRRRTSVPTTQSLREAGLVLVAMALVVTPWMGRNLHQFGTFGVSDRGGLAIWFRVTYNDMTPLEHRGAWVYFAPLPLRPVAADLLGLDLDDFEGDGALRRVAREAVGDEQERRSFYRLARTDRAELAAAYRAEGLPEWQAAHRADQDLMRRGVTALREDPSRFIRTLPVFLWRGTWFMQYSNLVPSVLLGPFNLVGMTLLMGALVVAVVRSRPRLLAVTGLAGGIVMFYALLTHFEPRQSRPAAPIMILLCVLAADLMVSEVVRRARRARSRGASDPALTPG